MNEKSFVVEITFPKKFPSKTLFFWVQFKLSRQIPSLDPIPDEQLFTFLMA
jgi:hypothetical protein